ncbi:MAG TPA: hypothetical protein VF076_02290 [Acidimicrobiales bacterium]
MRRALLLAAVALVIVAGCGGGSGSGAAGTTEDSAGVGVVAPATTPVVQPATLVPLDPASFSDPLRIDNAWFPMAPGTQLVLQGEADRGRGELAHRVEITVTDLSKVVHGVRARVVWERDFNEGVLRETELAFFAQDDAGNLWNLGEYPEEWDARRFAGAPSTWVSGHAGALGGIHVHGRPVVGSPTYVQGDAPAISFLDHARVAGLGAQACAPVGCFRDVLVVDEWDPLAQPADGHQLKHYAPGKGPVRVEPVGGEEQETLVLTEHRTVDAATLDRVRDAALRLDERAYRFQPKIWSATSPAERD